MLKLFDLNKKSQFEKCLKIILKHEGGFVNHPRDPGGMTNLGITKRVYEKWVGKTVDEATMRKLTLSNVSPIYKKEYWDKVKGDDLPAGVNLCVFDFAVNAGVSRGSQFLQRIIGANPDGVIGPKTLNALAVYSYKNGNKKLILEYQEARNVYYKSLSTFDVFGKGWLRRVEETTKLALKMV